MSLRPSPEISKPAMNKNLLSNRGSTDGFVSLGPVTREMVHLRTNELAVRAGRFPPQVAQADYERAKHELTGDADSDRQEEIIDSVHEQQRWYFTPRPTGRIL